MFDHVKFGVSDYGASRAFFLKALEPLRVTVVREWPPNGVELSRPEGSVSLCLYETHGKPAPLHVAFTAESRQQVEAFHRAALEAGGKDNGPPGLRPHYHANYYAAFVIGPDGHNIEAVCHAPAPVPRPESPSLQGTCHCGAVRLTLPSMPGKATRCNCSLCRRLGSVWAYYEFGTVTIEGHPEHTVEYIQGDRTLRTMRCRTCGVATHWEPLDPKPGARHGVSLNNFDPRLLDRVTVRRFDGADTWTFLE